MAHHYPKKKKNCGFTLIELMVTVSIIGLLSAVAIPSIMLVQNRNTLSEVVSDFQQFGSRARGLAMQTRNATVMTVGPDSVWVDVLDGPDCWSSLPDSGERMGNPSFVDLADPLSKADAQVCGIHYLAGTIAAGDAFALCYSGSGELYINDSPAWSLELDSSTDNDTDSEPDAQETDWTLTTGTQATATIADSGYTYNEGVVVLFNRGCGSDAADVERAVYFPIAAVPYSKAAP